MASALRPIRLTSGWGVPLLISVAAHGAIVVVLVQTSGTNPTTLTDVPGDGPEYSLTLAAEPTAPHKTDATPPVLVVPPEPVEAVAGEVQPDPVPPTAHETSAPPVVVLETPVDAQPIATAPSESPAVAESGTPSFRQAMAPRPTVAPEAARPATMPAVDQRSASFAGVRAERAKKVVYAVDASGVMVSSLPFVLDELGRNLAQLDPDQEYQVIVFQEPIRPQDESPGPEPSIERLLEHTHWIRRAPEDATPALIDGSGESSARKAQLEELRRRIKPGGPSNPLTGLRVALSLKPDVVFLLSRGIKRSGTAWGPGVEEVLAALDRANPKDASGRRAVQIKTVQFVEPDPTGLMDRIAKEHGGSGAVGGSGRAAVLGMAELRSLGRGANPKKK